jgi:hypothetical protein
MTTTILGTTVKIVKVSREEACDNCDYCKSRGMHIHWYVVRDKDNKLTAHTVACNHLMDNDVTDAINDENFQGFIISEKGCPFCNCKGVVTTSNGEKQYNVLCNGCGAEGPTGVDEKDAELKWNSR